MTQSEILRSRIVPLPKEFEIKDGSCMVLDKTSKFTLTCPFAEEGTKLQAKCELEEFLKNNFGESALCGGFPIELSLGKPSKNIENEQEGYYIKISASGIKVVGFGDIGLYYGAISLMSLLRFENGLIKLPEISILDWPEKKIRGAELESRYGTNLMERQDWLDAIDDYAHKKLNIFGIKLYGCWCVQYDGGVSEYIYLPIKGHPEFTKVMRVKYFSPKENKWIDYETLPPIFRDNFFGELVRYAKQRGVTVFPVWNSFGHNTLIPATYRQISAKDENGEPALTGFCTSNEATYNLLFSIYDDIIDNYLLPNGIDMFHAGLDEVHDEIAVNANDIFKLRSPWCKCEKCREKDKADIFIDHVIKVSMHLKEKGIKSIYLYCDMLLETRRQSLGNLRKKFEAAVKDANLQDVVVIDWWTYFDIPEKMYFHGLNPELGLRSIVKP